MPFVIKNTIFDDDCYGIYECLDKEKVLYYFMKLSIGGSKKCTRY